MNLSEFIKDKARELGFDACGIAEVSEAATEARYLDDWIAEGSHAGMAYMERNREVRLNPAELVEGARSVISVALNYYPEKKQPVGAPRIAFYAYGKDYHKVIKEKLRKLWQSVLEKLPAPHAARVFTDSAPLLERYWAWRAGLGWIGRNTNLIIPGKGSYFFLGEIVTTLQLSYDGPMKSRCGSCRRCLDACPTKALDRERHIDARRCISYLTIENKGSIPSALASRLGDRLYGCDTCQEVCPWNSFASATHCDDFRPTPALLALKKEDLKDFTRDDYNRIFVHSAVKRAGYEGLCRTIAAGKDNNDKNDKQ